MGRDMKQQPFGRGHGRRTRTALVAPGGCELRPDIRVRQDRAALSHPDVALERALPGPSCQARRQEGYPEKSPERYRNEISRRKNLRRCDLQASVPSSRSVTSAAIGLRSLRCNVTCPKSG